MTLGDLPVWVGQISRDIGVRLNRHTLVTHKMDPDVDETREYLLEDLAYALALEAPRGNLTGCERFLTRGFPLKLPA